MNKIVTCASKTLQLKNVLRVTCHMEQAGFNLNAALERMKTFIRARGAAQIGPVIQYMGPGSDAGGDVQIRLELMVQCDRFLSEVEPPYSTTQLLQVPGCLYCRYSGPQEKLNFAYDKLMIEAFEQDILLRGDSYTVYVSTDSEDDRMVADVFMPRGEV